MCNLQHTDLGWNAALLHLSYVAFGKSVPFPGAQASLLKWEPFAYLPHGVVVRIKCDKILSTTHATW